MMEFDHVGWVAPSIADANRIAAILGMDVGPFVHDAEQRSKVALAGGAERLVEFVVPAGPDSPVARHAATGGGLAHLSFRTDDIEVELRRLRQEGALVVSRPTPAKLFEGRRVAFVYLREGTLIELVEAEPQS